ncbi:MAG TPA: BTAD domain-containing putative transcriptional regulator [Streptosporangiaceae bacterium]|nr:BTAD domain-containing putative transcriptional regulator [Streptosporangiaceae bacterium]
MIYRLLGELQVVGEDGLLVDLPGGATLIVLAALLVNANRRMSKTALIRAAWGGEGEVGEAQLPKRVKVVRDLLATIGRMDDVKTHPGFGYEMRVDSDDVDTLSFQKLVRQADEAAARHRADDEIGRLREAFRLWRGPHPLSNVPGHGFRHEILALEQRYKRVAVRLFELEFGRGNYEAALDELILMTGYYPADQRLCEQLLRAQYRSGHVADMNDAYERYRNAIADEIGGDPDALLRNFHFAVARGEEDAITAALDALQKRTGAAAPAPAPARISAPVPAQLPRPAELIGRGDMIAEVKWLLGREPHPAMPVIVISGPGGIGKTALALCAANESRDRYPDGQLYMELRDGLGGAIDASEVAAQFLRTLGATRIPETKAERLAEYRTMLNGRRVLIVLDDAADGAQVSDLAPASPGCAVLVTARQRLPEVSSAHHVAPLEPLGQPDASDLFLRVVRDANVTIDDDRDAIDRVVRLCAGLPLALLIAGALRVHDHPRPTAELADRLARQGPEAFAFGKLSVDRTIGAGYERLDPPARQLFLALGLLPLTKFGAWTAAALAGDSGADPDAATASAALSQLAARFMIESVEPEMRYRFHDLTRDYARRRAAAEYPGDRDLVPVLAFRALLTLVRRAHSSLYGGDFDVVHGDVPDWGAPPGVLAEASADPLGWFEKERMNIRAAVARCAELGQADLCWDLAVSAHEFYTIRGYFEDWQDTHTRALAACRKAGDKRGEGIVLACLNQPALVASRRIDSASAVAGLERAASLLGEAGDRHGQAITLRTLAHALRRQGHLTRPLALFNEVLQHYSASGDQVGRWQTLRFIGQTYLDRGDDAKAQQVLEAAESIAAELGNQRLIAQTRYWLGQACLAMGDLDAAQVAFDAVFDVFRDDAGVGHAYARHGLGDVAWRTGAFGVADQHLTAAAARAKESADAGLEGRVWLSIAALRSAQGQFAGQLAALRQAVDIFAGCGAARLEARALAASAAVMSDHGDAAAAEAAWSRIERLYEAADLPAQDRLSHRPDY